MGNGYEKSVVVPEELAEPYSGGQRSGFARFCIQDSGIGIPEEDQSRLFESFHRASNVGTISGTGLGLAIVKNCVDLHKGQISVNSVIGVGTTFTVTLPLHYPAAT
jgi:signal transduction histidine kinase